MAAIAATSSATPSLQSTLLQSRVQQARREADQAEAYAENLREQADQQDRRVQQAHQRVQTLEKQSATTTGVNPSATRPSETLAQSQTQTRITSSYTQALAGTFQLAKPILTSDLSATQKNMVAEGLFEAATATWSAVQSRSQAIQSYTRQVVETPGKTIGRVLNTSV